MLAPLVVAVGLALATVVPPEPAPPQPPLAAAGADSAARLDQLIAEYDAWRFVEYPELGRARGADVPAGAVTQVGITAEGRRDGARQVFLDELLAIDPATLGARDRLDRELLALELRQALEASRRHHPLYAIGPLHGPQQSIPQAAERIRFADEADYGDYLRRLEWVPGNIRETIGLLRRGIELGEVPPKVILAGVPAQFDVLLHGPGLEPLRDPFRRMPATIAAERQDALRERFERETFPPIVDALGEFDRFLREEYVPACRDSTAASDGAGGREDYDFRLAQQTTLSLTADEIHRIGLAEVARIRAEMLAVIRRTDWYLGDPARSVVDDDALFTQFLAFLRSDPRFYHRDADALLAEYRDICKRIDAELPRLFGRLPRLPYGVRAVPRFMAPTQTTAYYQSGSIAEGEPGWFFANTYALDQRPRYEMIALSLHEAVPGHHLQIALAQEVEGLREFRRDVDATAFVEGWALYAERLGIAMGLYEDPYADFGRLLYEMWRSTRLVVDTGMHALGWSRERAIAYMLENTALSELNIRNEIDRYLSWPGQACAYKLGELTIRRLRSEAETALGDRFDLRAFHDAVLEQGPIPLTILESAMRRWIDAASGEKSVHREGIHHRETMQASSGPRDAITGSCPIRKSGRSGLS